MENTGKDKDAGLLGFGDVGVEPQILAMEVRVSVLANVEGVKNLKRIFSLQRISSHGVGWWIFCLDILIVKMVLKIFFFTKKSPFFA